MINPAFTSAWRFKFLIILVLPVFFLLGTQLWWLQIEEASYLRGELHEEQLFTRVETPERGDIVDSQGCVLAHSKRVWDIVLEPYKMAALEDNKANARARWLIGKSRGLTRQQKEDMRTAQHVIEDAAHEMRISFLAETLGRNRADIEKACKVEWYIPVPKDKNKQEKTVRKKTKEREKKQLAQTAPKSGTAKEVENAGSDGKTTPTAAEALATTAPESAAGSAQPEEPAPTLRESPFSVVAKGCRYVVEKTNIKEKFFEDVKNASVEFGRRSKAPLKGMRPRQRSILLAKGVGFEVMSKIRDEKIPGVRCKMREIRVYPQGELAAQVIGLLGQDGTPVMGIEKALDEHLKGLPGIMVSKKDAYSNELPERRKEDKPPVHGKRIQLTLDSRIQKICEMEALLIAEKYTPRAISILVSEPSTGKLRAFVNWPSFKRTNEGNLKQENPFGFADYQPEQDAKEKKNAKDGTPEEKPGTSSKRSLEGLYSIRGISEPYEPGSVFKILSISAALNEGVVTPEDEFITKPGVPFYQAYRGNKIGPFPKELGIQNKKTLRDVIRLSSNRGTVLAVLRMTEPAGGEELYWKYLQKFGIGSKSGIHEVLSGSPEIESSGILRSPIATKNAQGKTIRRTWDGLTVTRLPIGQSVAVTPIQMHYAVSVVANEGKLMKPMLVERIASHASTVNKTDEADQTFLPVLRNTPITPQTARLMATLLRDVCRVKGSSGANGTPHISASTGVQAESAEYEPAGKTGTAEQTTVVVDASGKRSSVYNGEYVASFCGFFPFDSPRYVISVIVDEPQWPDKSISLEAQKKSIGGGSIAAPYFKHIMEAIGKTFEVPTASQKKAQAAAAMAWQQPAALH